MDCRFKAGVGGPNSVPGSAAECLDNQTVLGQRGILAHSQLRGSLGPIRDDPFLHRCLPLIGSELSGAAPACA